jgi:Cu(I)/Ag(I) efflux system membrane fusion protein
MSRKVGFAFLALVLAAAGAGAGYWFAMHRMMAETTAQVSAPPPAGKKPLYWHDPMYPQQKFDKPGKSPFMDMQLVPVYADSAGDEGSVAISPRAQQNLGIRTVEAVRGDLTQSLTAVGAIAYDERDVAVVQARASGFVEKVHVRASFDRVRRGQPLADLYVPDWIAAQEEYLGLLRMAGTDLDALREGALQRMRLAGMPEDVIHRVTSSHQLVRGTTVNAPIAGVISELGAREGMSIAPGTLLFRINGLGTVWINAEVPESVAAQVRPGIAVEARATALPGQVFKGQVSAILPEVNPVTRTLKARVEVPNPDGRLVPGMFATVTFASAVRRESVLVPTEAVIQTGKRAVVVVAEKTSDGKQVFRPVDVQAGGEANGFIEILKGIDAGTKVVASGQFLIDSEASLKSSMRRLAEPADAAPVTSIAPGGASK